MLARHYAKFCDVADFDDPELLDQISAILPERDARAHVERKVWEFAMLALFAREVGILGDDSARVLAVGAGTERMLYWMANHAGHVLAVDVYGEGKFAAQEADARMLVDPRAFAPFPYREDRLEARAMDARALDLPDASFDLVFSLSSFEHFGGAAGIRQAMAEVARVLRPGGRAYLAIDCFVRLHPRNTAPVDTLVRALTLGRRRRIATPWRRAAVGDIAKVGEVRRAVRRAGLEMLQEFDPSLSGRTWENLTFTFGEAGELVPATGSFYPHVLLRAGRSVFTSAGFPLRRPE